MQAWKLIQEPVNPKTVQLSEVNIKTERFTSDVRFSGGRHIEADHK